MTRFILFVLTLTLGACSWLPGRQPAADTERVEVADAPEQVIEPRVERRDVVVPKIDTENFELGLLAGVLNVEDFGSEPVFGLRGAFHITEDFFVEASYERSEVSDTAFRRVGLNVFPMETEDLEYYGFALGYNVLPGEVFAGTRHAMTSAMYLVAGAGNTRFVDEDRLTYTIGFGLRVLPGDWIALRLQARDNIFESDLLGENKFTHNLQLDIGFTFFF